MWRATVELDDTIFTRSLPIGGVFEFDEGTYWGGFR